MRVIKLLALAASFLCLVDIQADAREWFVSLHGSDANDGTVDRPLATIQKACGLAQTGDIVTVRGGTYFISDQIRPLHSGTADNWILYRAMPGEKVIIDAIVKTVSGVQVPLFEAKIPYKALLKGLDNQLRINLDAQMKDMNRYEGLQVGSVTAPNNNAGNWE